ncbi:MAG: methyltransferase domain-containing protein [Planctomycetaceae bacterium]|nr:methyltransferase domain-containing protein [Planctomycetaceae bacterium]
MTNEEPAKIQPDVQRVFETEDQARAYYNKIAKVYDLLAEHSEQPMRDKGIALLSAQPGERVLEIGFGTGHCIVELAKAVGSEGRVFGIDISDQMVEVANGRCEEAGVSAWTELSQGDAADLTYEDDTFDAIFSSFTLELFDTPEIPDVLKECYRVLKPGGRIVDVSVSKEGKQGVFSSIYEWSHKHFPNLVDCRPIHVQKAIEAAGFTVEKSQIESMWVPVEIILGRKP